MLSASSESLSLEVAQYRSRWKGVEFVLSAVVLFAVSLQAAPPNSAPEDAKTHRRQLSQSSEQRAESEYRKRAFPLGYIPPGARAKGLAQTRAADANQPQLTTSSWHSIGPAGIEVANGTPFIQYVSSGRVPALAVDPTNASHWLIGAAQGGIWETFNSGTNWQSGTDGEASLAMGAIAFAPSNPFLAYAGTGEPNFRPDAYAGQGLLRSTDGGDTWQMLNTNFADTSFSHVLVNPAVSNALVVATVRGAAGIFEESSGSNLISFAPSRGVFVSTNGGTNFTQVLIGEATALAACPTNFNFQYAGLGEIYGAASNGVYRTTDGWATGQLISGPWTSLATPSQMGRIAMAAAPTDPNTFYVGISGSRSNYVAPLLGLWCSTNAWAVSPSWTALSLTNGPADINTNDTVNFPRLWYYFDLLVDATNSQILYLANYNVWRYYPLPSPSNSIPLWSSLADSIHPDNHIMAWVPAGNNAFEMLLGNDGGVWLSDSENHLSWQSLNVGLPIAQIYKGAVDPTHNSTLTLAGIQDDFTDAFYGSNQWIQVWYGDGGDCAIAAANPAKQWAASFSVLTDPRGNFAGIGRTVDGAMNFDWDYAADSLDAYDSVLPNYQEFFVHFAKSPNIDDFFIAGDTQLLRCTNFFSSSPHAPLWVTNGPVMLDTNGSPVPISAVAWAPSDLGESTYAYGTEDGQLRITSDSGVTWAPLDPSHSLPGRYVSGLAFSPTNAEILYVTFSGFDEATPGQPGHMFVSSNALAGVPTWSNISPPVDLPNNCVTIDAGTNNPGPIYVGTDIGLWTTTDGGTSWSHYGPANGMPNVAVYDVQIDSNSRVTAFTHGRSAFVLSTSPIIIPPHEFGCLYCPLDCPSCNPGERWLNPGDEVEVQFPLLNSLNVPTVDLQVTMLATPGVTPITRTQDYGAMGQGVTVARTFTFIAGTAPGGGSPAPAGSTCGGTLQVVFQLQDQGNDLGQVTVPFLLGEPNYPLVENFQEVPLGGLPGGWIPMTVGTGMPWMVTTNPPPNLPDAGEDDFPSTSFPPGAFVPDSPGSGQSSVTTMPFLIQGAQAQLFFHHSFLFAPTNDGGVLEIAIGSLPFIDILQAGGSFSQNGYDVVLSDLNPLGTRSAWSGDSGGWLPTWVNLPASAAGQTIQLRWRFAGISGLANGGWFINSVRVVDPACLPSVVNPLIVNPGQSNGLFTFAINTVSNRTYIVETKTNLTDPAWQSFQTVAGDGTQKIIQAPDASPAQRFFRFLVQ